MNRYFEQWGCMSRSSSDHRAAAPSVSGKTMSDVILSSELLEALPDAIVAVDSDGTIVQVNSQVLELFGYSRGELVGQKVEMLVPESYRPQHHHHRKNFTEAPNGSGFGSLRQTAQRLGIPGRNQSQPSLHGERNARVERHPRHQRSQANRRRTAPGE